MSGRSSEQAYHMPRKNRVIVLEDMNFIWDEWELEELAQCWKKGVNIYRLAERYERDPDEVLLALMHLAREDRIKQRDKGLRGVSV